MADDSEKKAPKKNLDNTPSDKKKAAPKKSAQPKKDAAGAVPGKPETGPGAATPAEPKVTDGTAPAQDAVAAASAQPKPKRKVIGAKPGARPRPTGAAAAAAASINGKQDQEEEEERRRRMILALWLVMFAVLIVVFVILFYQIFGNLQKPGDIGNKCLECHAQHMQRQLGSQYIHEPFGRELCVECHEDVRCNTETKKFAVVKGSLEKVCLGCHAGEKNALKKKFGHKPFVGKRCTDCHDPHGSAFEKLTVLPPTELCVSCHYGSDFKMEVKHQPATDRNCVDCHEPHASDIVKGLVLPVSQLCYSCHFKVAQQNLRPVKHQPFGTGDCTSCHRPHSTKEKRLLSMEYAALCASCHQPIIAEFGLPSHHPLGIDPMKNCGVCHLYHAAEYRKLLPLPGTVNCYQSQCHPDLQAYFDTSEHNSSVMGMLSQREVEVTCSACHSPHGAEYGKLLTVDRYTVCLVCHTTQQGDPTHRQFAHAYGPPFEDRWHGGYLWCGSCHNFHGSPNPVMRLALGDDLCLKCHDAASLENTRR